MNDIIGSVLPCLVANSLQFSFIFSFISEEAKHESIPDAAKSINFCLISLLLQCHQSAILKESITLTFHS